MFKNAIIFIISFFFLPFLLLNCSNKTAVNDSDMNITEGDNPTFIKLSDSITVPFDSIEWDTPLRFAVIDDDTLFADTFQLKNNYQLILFPMADGYDSTNQIVYGHYGKLVGTDIDSVLLTSYGTSPAKYWLRYDNIDFDNCFAVEYSGGGNYAMYINLFDKKTGAKILEGHSGTTDIKNQVIQYLDDETGEIMIYDVRKGKKAKVNLPNNPCFESMGYHTEFKITKVTPNSIFVKYENCDKPIMIEVKR